MFSAAAYFLLAPTMDPAEEESSFSVRSGTVVSKTGELRRRHKADPTWSLAEAGATLFLNDSLYLAPQSKVSLDFLNKQFKLSGPGYYHLRKHQDVASIDLTHGRLKTSLLPRDELRLGEPQKDVLIKSQRDSQLEVQAVTDGLRIRIVEGQLFAEAIAYRSTLKAPSVFTIHRDGRVTEAEQEKIFLSAPRRDEQLYIHPGAPVQFSWLSRKLSNEYQVVISDTPGFENSKVYRSTESRLSVKLPISAEKLYWRVISSEGEYSSINQFKYNLLHRPLPLSPRHDASLQAPISGEALEVDFQVEARGAPRVELSLAKDPHFLQEVGHSMLTEPSQSIPLEPGEYFWRIRSHYTDSHHSSWSETQSFVVNPPLEQISDSESMPPLKLAFIPNMDYPQFLYASQSDEIKAHLKKSAFLSDFFSPIERPMEADIELVVAGHEQSIMVTDTSWPQSLLEPGSYTYRYRLIKQGLLPSSWSDERQLEISLQAPRHLTPVEAQAHSATGEGLALVKLEWTPLLYAKKYELVVADPSGIEKPSRLVVTSTSMDFPADPSKALSWKVRALSENWIPLSPFSDEQILKVKAPPVHRDLAFEDFGAGAPTGLKPQLSSTTSLARRILEREDQSYFWGWLGSGLTFFSYGQSQVDEAALNFSGLETASISAEGGFFHPSGYGVRLAYKRIPGTVQGVLAGAPEYTWSNVAVEALYRLNRSKTKNESYLTYGLNVGLLYHSTPNLYIDSNDEVNLGSASLVTAGLGGDLSLRSGGWTYEGLLRYEHPINSSSTTADFVVSPEFSFSGSIGMSYHFTEALKAGLFWYGHWLNHKFVRSYQGQPTEGSESLLFSNMDLRLGFDF